MSRTLTQMSDIYKTIQNEFRETDGSGAEGVILGCKMFDEFRAEIVASPPRDLSEEEFKKELFRRTPADAPRNCPAPDYLIPHGRCSAETAKYCDFSCSMRASTPPSSVDGLVAC